MRFPILQLFISLFVTLPSYAGTRLPLVPEMQKGLVTWASVYEAKEEDEGIWKTFCENLGEELLSDPGPGFLADYSCARTGDSGKKGFLWHLHFMQRRDSLELTVSFEHEDIVQDVRSWQFPTIGSARASLSNKLLALVIARFVTESLPTGRALLRHDKGYVFERGAEIAGLPETLFVYELAYERKEKAWMPRILARLRKSDENLDAALSTYTVETQRRPLKSKKAYWVRGLMSQERENKYQAIIQNLLQGKSDQDLPPTLLKYKDDGTLLDIFTAIRSSYAGVRYGRSLLASQSLVSKTSLLSLYAEIGGGPLAGLRWSYDLYPEISRGAGEEKEFFQMKRASLGWAFKFPLPKEFAGLVDAIDLQPKIGLLDLKSHFIQESDGDRIGLDFNVKNVYDLAIEAGLDKSTPWFRTRIWGGLSTANLGVSRKSSTKVQTQHAGLDLYYNLSKYSGWDVNVLAFLMAERLEFAKDPEQLSDERSDIYFFHSNLVFAGLGFTVSW